MAYTVVTATCTAEGADKPLTETRAMLAKDHSGKWHRRVSPMEPVLVLDIRPRPLF